MQSPINILERYWNFTSFKPLQEDIINDVLENEDTLALLPTGGGKSVCFQIPALVKEGICIVVSPLIALMTDQVNGLKEKGIKAMALTSKYSLNDIDIMLDNCIYGHYKFLYLSPERLQQELVQNRITQMNVNLIAVDEAHCISQWGNDFRPAYKSISILRELLPHVNILALTASATPLVIDDIVKELDMLQPQVFKQSFYRPNLAYMVFKTEDKLYKLEQILKKNPESSIIYVRNRKSTISYAKLLEQNGFSCTYYHGGLSNSEKEKHFQLWKNNVKQVMIATNAFGMGIDKADVKTVVHINLPESIESYFQEAGRAGRNDKKAYAVILTNKSDEIMVKQQFLSVLPKVDFVKTVYRKLCNYFQISYGEGEFTSHSFNFNEFCKVYDFNTLIAYNALLHLDRTSIISLSKQFEKRTLVQVIAGNDVLFSYFKKYPQIAPIVKAILRTYGGIFDHEVDINLSLVADKSSNSEEQVIKTLKQLQQDELINLKLKLTDAEITFLQPREDDRTINRISPIIIQQNKLKKKQVDAVLRYIENNLMCKSSQLLSYFGEEMVDDCGICSVCIAKNKTEDIHPSDIMDSILTLLETGPSSSRYLTEQLDLKETIVTSSLKLLLENNKIEVTRNNTYKLKS